MKFPILSFFLGNDFFLGFNKLQLKIGLFQLETFTISYNKTQ